MGLIRRISEQRERLIEDHARPHLADKEDVIQWVRARRTEGRGEGFVYLTVDRCLIVWVGSDDEASSARWDEMLSWGLNPKSPGGPLLAIETESGPLLAKINATTGRMAEDVAAFIRRFSELAPQPDRPPRGGGRHGPFKVASPVPVSARKPTLGGLTRRFAITLLGGTLATIGILIIPLPGPWSLPLILAGLAVLGSEYDWAKDILDWSKEKYKSAREKIRNRRRSRA
jgi:hypothetical protein